MTNPTSLPVDPADTAFIEELIQRRDVAREVAEALTKVIDLYAVQKADGEGSTTAGASKRRGRAPRSHAARTPAKMTPDDDVLTSVKVPVGEQTDQSIAATMHAAVRLGGLKKTKDGYNGTGT